MRISWGRRARRAGPAVQPRHRCQAVENCGVRTLKRETLRNGLAVNWSPRGQLFSLFINSTYRVSGIIFWGWGSLAFVWLGAGVDAVVALGRAACAPVPAGRLHPRVIGRGEFHLAGQLVTVVRHPRAVVARRTPIRLPPPPRRPATASSPCRPTIVLRLRRPAIARVLRRSAIVLGAVLSRAVFGVKLAAGALLVAVVALAIMNYRDPEPAVTGVEPADNETVVYRRAAPAHARSEEAKPADQGDEAGSQYPRAVQTVRFGNPDPPLSITAAAREMIKRALIKVGAFVAFPAREPVQETTEMRRKRGTVILEGIDDYLWEVYQRAPIKKDSTGDFTWKDPTA